MYIVYEPKGAAREYSELACNLYMGCTHGCTYCFAPACMRKKPTAWHSEVSLRKNGIALLEKDARQLRGDTRRVLLSFLSDPYQPIERTEQLTRQALTIFRNNNVRSQILTKGSPDLIRRDFDLMKSAKTELGITLTFFNDQTRKEWEPHAASVEDRLAVLKEAHQHGISTWVSLEPVIDPEQALALIRAAAPYVGMWKIGKLNHMKAHENRVDWHKFRVDVENVLKEYGSNYILKNSLKKY